VNGPGRVADDDIKEIHALGSGVITYRAEPGVVLNPGDDIICLSLSDGRSLQAAILNLESKNRERENQEKAQRLIALGLSEDKRGCTVEEYVARAASVVRARVDEAKAYAEYEALKRVSVRVGDPGYERGYFVPNSTGNSVTVGTYVSQGTLLGKYINQAKNTAVITVTLSQQDCSMVEMGQPAIFTVGTPSGPLALDGKVVGIDRSSDSAIYGTKVRVLCESLTPQELKSCAPGADVTVAILITRLPCFFVESAAIMDGWLLIKVTPTTQNYGIAQAVPVRVLWSAYGYSAFTVPDKYKDLLKEGDGVKLAALDHPLRRWVDAEGNLTVTIPVSLEKIGSVSYATRNVQISGDTQRPEGQADERVA